MAQLHEYFWDGYEGRGEPYGLINLELSRSCGRLGETQYPDPDVQGYNPCAEQSLASFETCCLAEVFLPNVTCREELYDICELLYRINKHSLMLPSHHPETEAIVHKNMRMGIGQTGILQASAEQRSWLSGCYEYLRAFDTQYSEIMDLIRLSSLLLSNPQARSVCFPVSRLAFIPPTRNTCIGGFASLRLTRLWQRVETRDIRLNLSDTWMVPRITTQLLSHSRSDTLMARNSPPR
jgi:hypothetical protein